MVSRQNADGILYGITYVDHQTKCVFNGSSLGKAYSAKGIMERFAGQKESTPEKQEPSSKKKVVKKTISKSSSSHYRVSVKGQQTTGVLDALFQPEPGSDYVPPELTRKTRKKRRNVGSNTFNY